jgi:hypothetical protein
MDPTSGVSLESSFRFGYYCGGFSAVPVMTMGAAYDLAQTIGWKQGLCDIRGGQEVLWRDHGIYDGSGKH